MMKVKNIKVTMPKKVKVTKEQKEEFDRNLLLKKIRGYGFFNKEGKWKEK